MSKNNYLYLKHDKYETPFYLSSNSLILRSTKSYDKELPLLLDKETKNKLYSNYEQYDRYQADQEEITKKYIEQLEQIISVANVLCESEMIKCHKELEALIEKVKTQ